MPNADRRMDDESEALWTFEQGRARLVAATDAAETAAAVAIIRRAAEAGLPAAETELGVCYQRGQGVAADPEAAAAWFQRAAARGDPWGQNNFGICCLLGHGTGVDRTAGAGWIQKAAAQGLVQAQMTLASLALRGTGMARSPATALSWYLQAAEGGDPTAQAIVGDCYLHGKLTARRDPSAALQWCERAAKHNQALALTNLGWMHEYGLGVAVDRAQAAAFYDRAIAAGGEAATIARARRQRRRIGSDRPGTSETVGLWHRLRALLGRAGNATE